MDKIQHSLTNEQTLKKFKSQFDFVSYAIRLAENLIRSGRNPRVKIQTQNPALQILAEIEAGKDHFEEIPVAAPVVIKEEYKPRPQAPQIDNMGQEAMLMKKAAEKKKPRKLIPR